jgi:hypothetical protein
LAPLHAARWDALDRDIELEREPAAVLDVLCSWASSSVSESVFWLRAEDGTTSSTLVRRFCQHLVNFRLLGASFFVERQARLHEPVNIIHSIAYQLAIHDSAFARAICAILRESPDLHTRRLHEQCTRLLYEPAATIQDPSPVFIVIDAFDMCAQDAQARDGLDLVKFLFDVVSKARGSYKLLFTSHISEKTQGLLGELNECPKYRSLFRPHTMKCAMAMDKSASVPTQLVQPVAITQTAVFGESYGHSAGNAQPAAHRGLADGPIPGPSSHSGTKDTRSNARVSAPVVLLAVRSPSGGSRVGVPIQSL